jgi:AcrR family transcriptional regulator
MKHSKPTTSPESQDRLKQAAREIFLRKGLDAARSHEIAALAGTNPGLISYYFKSKEHLFDLVLTEVMNEFIGKVELLANNSATNFEHKVHALVDCYSNMVLESPYLPLYSLNVIRRGHSAVVTYTKQMRNMLHRSVMARQFQQEIEAGNYKPATIALVLMNLLGLTVFPAIASPIIQTMGDTTPEEYERLIRSRQPQIAEWVLFTLR